MRADMIHRIPQLVRGSDACPCANGLLAAATCVHEARWCRWWIHFLANVNVEAPPTGEPDPKKDVDGGCLSRLVVPLIFWVGMALMAASLPLFVLLGCYGQVMTVAGIACLCIGATIAIVSDSIMLKRLEECIQHLSPEEKRSVWMKVVW